ncbi:pectate lyase [Colletotrichum tofieldiae]|uniref:Pectate lyase n=1 Tax=Colletotrichum tofieldiae TaxID=708197 RepID=A0A166U881_9PEZI|nr:pectate lyase [Colletotrichum tofieldiae]
MGFAKIIWTALFASVVAGQTLTIPTRAGSIISLSAPSAISGSKDLGNREYDRGRSCETDVETPGGHPVFILEDGATLSNVIIGAGQVEGIHCRGACTLKNVWFRRACDYSIILNGNGNVLVEGGGVQGRAETAVFHKGRGTVTVKNFTAIDSGRLYRSCGDCFNNGGPRNIVVENLKAKNINLIAGINSNFGDTATVAGSCGAGVTKVCQEFKGVNKGQESPKVTTTANCKGQLSLGAC